MAFANLTQSNITAHSTFTSVNSSSTFLLTSSSGTTATNNTTASASSSTSSSNNTTQRQSTRNNAFEVPIWLILCYSVILLCAIVGNLLVISTLVQNRRMRTITNVFLLNLAISDILLGVLCMPVTLVGTLLRHFIFGEFFCKLIQFSQAASVAVSSWTLVAISCERYYAICHPLRSRRWQTRSHAYKIIACIWCGSMMCMLPIAMFSQLMPTSRQGFRKCRENWPSYALPYERSYNIFLDLILLVLPLMILSVAYILITRTLYVGMRIEKAMIFGGKQEDISSTFQRRSNSGSLLGKSSFLSTSSLSTTASSTSRFKLNLSLRCHDGATTASYNNISSTRAIANHQGNLENNIKETDIFSQQQQQQKQQQHHQHNHQLPAQRLYHQHNFQNYQQQHQITLHEGGQREQQLHHTHYPQHQQQQQQQQPCCEPISRLCCKRSTSSSTNSYSGRPHLYCMRFATLKTTTTPADKEANLMSNFCTTDCCSNTAAAATATATTTNINPINSNLTTATMTLTSSPSSSTVLASTSSSNSTMFRYQMQQQFHNNHHHSHQQHNHARCYCMVQQVMPQCNNKTDTKKSFNSKRSLKITESVLRRNNIAKNLESKKRVVKMLSVLVLEFFICWTPLYVINTVAMYIGSAIYEYIDYTSISVLQLLAYSSSCCNPITYCFMNANFRRAFWDTFKGMQWCGKRFQRKRSTNQNGGNLCLVGSIRVNSCTVQTVIDSPRL